MAKITPRQGEILAYFQPGEKYKLGELAKHFETSPSLLQIELGKTPRIQNFGGTYRLMEESEGVPLYMTPEMNLRKHYGSVLGRVADARAIRSLGGD